MQSGNSTHSPWTLRSLWYGLHPHHITVFARHQHLLAATGRMMSSGALMFRTTGRVLANPRSRRIRANVPSVFPRMRATAGTRRSSSFQARMTMPVAGCIPQ